MLVQRSGEIVTREEVRQGLWPENTFVEFDNSLGVAIRKVRESLNDNAEAPNVHLRSPGARPTSHIRLSAQPLRSAN